MEPSSYTVPACARPAERRKVGDNGVGLDHHVLVAAKYPQRRVAGCDIDRVVERIQSGQSVTGAKPDLAPPEINGVGQENVGTGEVNFHLNEAADGPDGSRRAALPRSSP
jgi:hypothetical protein